MIDAGPYCMIHCCVSLEKVGSKGEGKGRIYVRFRYIFKNIQSEKLIEM